MSQRCPKCGADAGLCRHTNETFERWASESKPAQPAEPLDHPCRDTCSGWRQGFERGRAEHDALNVQWRAKWEQALDSRDSLTAEIERLRAENADLERSREMLARKESEYLDRCKERDEARRELSASESQNQRLREMCELEEVKRLRQELDEALAEVERLRDMLDDLQLPKVGREEPKEIK